MEDHTEMLIGIMQKTIEQKDEQIKELRQTIADLQATVANLNETLEEFRRNFSDHPAKRPDGKPVKKRNRSRKGRTLQSKAIPGRRNPNPNGRICIKICLSGK